MVNNKGHIMEEMAILFTPELIIQMLIFGAAWILFEIIWQFIGPHVMNGIKAIAGYLPPPNIIKNVKLGEV